MGSPMPAAVSGKYGKLSTDSGEVFAEVTNWEIEPPIAYEVIDPLGILRANKSSRAGVPPQFIQPNRQQRRANKSHKRTTQGGSR